MRQSCDYPAPDKIGSREMKCATDNNRMSLLYLAGKTSKTFLPLGCGWSSLTRAAELIQQSGAVVMDKMQFQNFQVPGLGSSLSSRDELFKLKDMSMGQG